MHIIYMQERILMFRVEIYYKKHSYSINLCIKVNIVSCDQYPGNVLL